MGRQTIAQELKTMTRSRCRFGESKREAKNRDLYKIRKHSDIDKFELESRRNFYSKKTYQQYINTAVRFCKWSNSQFGKRIPVDSDLMRSYIEPYLNFRKEENVSAWTLQTERTIISKIFMVDLDYIQMPKRRVSVKGRGIDRHWNPLNHQAQVRFYQSIGVRKNEYRFLQESEINALEKKWCHTLPRDLHGRVSNLQPIWNEEHTAIIKIVTLKAKHGKTNTSLILEEDQKLVTEAFTCNKNDRRTYEDYYYPSDHCNVHAQRRIYAQKLYMHFRRDLSKLPEKELYRCRNALKGCVYDKKALDITSRNIGHGKGRYSDLVHHYLR